MGMKNLNGDQWRQVNITCKPIESEYRGKSAEAHFTVSSSSSFHLAGLSISLLIYFEKFAQTLFEIDNIVENMFLK